MLSGIGTNIPLSERVKLYCGLKGEPHLESIEGILKERKDLKEIYENLAQTLYDAYRESNVTILLYEKTYRKKTVAAKTNSIDEEFLAITIAEDVAAKTEGDPEFNEIMSKLRDRYNLSDEKIKLYRKYFAALIVEDGS